MARWKQEVSGENCWMFLLEISLQKTCGHCFLDQHLGQVLYKKKSVVVEHLGFLKDFLEEFGLGTRSNTHQEGSKVVSSARKQTPPSQPPMMTFDLPRDVRGLWKSSYHGWRNHTQFLPIPMNCYLHPLGSLITNLFCHEVGDIYPHTFETPTPTYRISGPFLVGRGCCMNLPPLTFLYYPTWCDVGCLRSLVV